MKTLILVLTMVSIFTTNGYSGEKDSSNNNDLDKSCYNNARSYFNKFYDHILNTANSQFGGTSYKQKEIKDFKSGKFVVKTESVNITTYYIAYLNKHNKKCFLENMTTQDVVMSRGPIRSNLDSIRSKKEYKLYRVDGPDKISKVGSFEVDLPNQSPEVHQDDQVLDNNCESEKKCLDLLRKAEQD